MIYGIQFYIELLNIVKGKLWNILYIPAAAALAVFAWMRVPDILETHFGNMQSERGRFSVPRFEIYFLTSKIILKIYYPESNN